MPAIGWQKRLDEASTLEEVVDVCRDFLVLWKPAELAELGVDFRPAQHLEVGDVSPYALKLLMKMGVGDRATAPMLHRMSTFFTKAALRLADITAPSRHAPPGESHKRGPRS
jgi:hypothetical protein